MKNNIKISLSAIGLVVLVSFTSCSVEYRTRHPHPHPHHEKIIVVGMEKANIPVDSVAATLAVNVPVKEARGSNASR